MTIEDIFWKLIYKICIDPYYAHLELGTRGLVKLSQIFTKFVFHDKKNIFLVQRWRVLLSTQRALVPMIGSEDFEETWTEAQDTHFQIW